VRCPRPCGVLACGRDDPVARRICCWGRKATIASVDVDPSQKRLRRSLRRALDAGRNVEEQKLERPLVDAVGSVRVGAGTLARECGVVAGSRDVDVAEDGASALLRGVGVDRVLKLATIVAYVDASASFAL
jgi:hypothetical protein